MNNVTTFPEQKQPDLLVGPFEEWRVMHEGRFVPGLTGFREGDVTWLVVDQRFGGRFSTEKDARQAARLIAEALAVAAGYPHFSADSKDQPFAALAIGIEEIPR